MSRPDSENRPIKLAWKRAAGWAVAGVSAAAIISGCGDSERSDESNNQETRTATVAALATPEATATDDGVYGHTATPIPEFSPIPTGTPEPIKTLPAQERQSQYENLRTVNGIDPWVVISREGLTFEPHWEPDDGSQPGRESLYKLWGNDFSLRVVETGEIVRTKEELKSKVWDRELTDDPRFVGNESNRISPSDSEIALAIEVLDNSDLRTVGIQLDQPLASAQDGVIQLAIPSVSPDHCGSRPVMVKRTSIHTAEAQHPDSAYAEQVTIETGILVDDAICSDIEVGE